MKSILIVISLLVSGLAYGQTAEEYYDRGIAKKNLEDYRGAIADFSKGIELYPLNPGTAFFYRIRGVCKFELEDYRGAIADFSKGIELYPNNPDAYNNRGLCKIKLGQKDDGCMDLSKAGELGAYSAYDLIKQNCN